MKKIIFIIVFACGQIFAAMGAAERAEALYNHRDWKGAFSEYTGLIDEGYTNWSLFYNAGNCCYRMNDFPGARLYYQKALRMKPRNGDIAHNLNIVEKKLNVRKENRSFLVAFVEYFSMSEVKTAVVIIFWLCLLFAILFTLTGKELYVWAASLFLIIFLFAAAAFYGKYVYEKPGRWGIVIARENMMSGPGNSYKVIAEIPAGERIDVSDREDGWVFATAGGSSGWINEKSVGKI